MVCSRGRSGVDGEAIPARTLPAAWRGDGVYVPAGTDGARTRQRRRRPAVHHTVVRPRQQSRNHRQDRQVGLPFVLSTSVIGRQCQMAGKWKGNGGSGVVLSTSVSASQSTNQSVVSFV